MHIHMDMDMATKKWCIACTTSTCRCGVYVSSVRCASMRAGDAFMRIEFQRTLEGNSNYDPLAPHPGYWATFFQLNAEMLSANARWVVWLSARIAYTPINVCNGET